MERAGERERGEFLGDTRGEWRGEGPKRLEGRWKAGCAAASSSSSRLWASSSWSLKVLRRREWQDEPELRLDAVAAYSCLRPDNGQNTVTRKHRTRLEMSARGGRTLFLHARQYLDVGDVIEFVGGR